MEILKLILILLLATSSYSQFTIKEVGEDSSKVIVKVPQADSNSTQQKVKSEWGAAFMSLALPGTGQLYLEQKNKGVAYISADVILFMGAILTKIYSTLTPSMRTHYCRILLLLVKFCRIIDGKGSRNIFSYINNPLLFF